MGRKPLPTRLPFARTRAPASWRANYLRPKWIIAAAAGPWLLSFLFSGSNGHGRSLGSRQLAEQLSDRLAADQLTQHTPAQLRQGFQSAIGSSASNSSTSGLQLAPKHDSFLLSHLHTLVQQLTHGPSTVKCWVDYTLFRQELRVSASHRVLLAANMHNNEELLPHYLAQLIHVLSLLPPGSAFLSIYESGSTDATGGQRWQPCNAEPPIPSTADRAPCVQPCGCRS